jgi:hypothetical protein
MPGPSGWTLSVSFLHFLLCLNLAQFGFAQKRESCVLTGTVVNSATNAGIPRALVSYFGAASGFRFTDVGGNFQVQGLQCGGYSLMVSKPGFVSGQEELSQPGLLLNPMLRETIENQVNQPGSPPTPTQVSVNLQPGSQPKQIPLVPVASIVGTVLDENGEPLGGVSVQAITAKASLSGTDYVSKKTAHTDDRGRYELLGLTPGDYLVRLGGESSSTRYFTGSAPNPNNDHRGMQPVYYPNVDTLASASVSHLAPGDRANADFRQVTESAFDVNGRLSGFVPQAWTQLRLYRNGDRIPVGRAFVNLTSGQFRLTDVVRGSYSLRVEQYQADPPMWFAAEEPITVTTEPIQNLAVQLSGAVEIPVSVSYEAGAQDDGMLQLTLQPQHSPENSRQLSIGRSSGGMRIQFDPAVVAPKPEAEPAQPKAFTNVIPDQYKLSVQTLGNGVGYVASAKLGDADVLHGEFSIGGSNPGELHITVRGDSATVQGVATFQGQAALGAQIYLIPTAGAGAGVKFGFAGPDGHYGMKGVPPGEYRIRAWTGSPTAKDILSGAGETLTLQPSEQRTVSLEAIAAEQK